MTRKFLPCLNVLQLTDTECITCFQVDRENLCFEPIWSVICSIFSYTCTSYTGVHTLSSPRELSEQDTCLIILHLMVYMCGFLVTVTSNRFGINHCSLRCCILSCVDYSVDCKQSQFLGHAANRIDIYSISFS